MPNSDEIDQTRLRFDTNDTDTHLSVAQQASQLEGTSMCHHNSVATSATSNQRCHWTDGQEKRAAAAKPKNKNGNRKTGDQTKVMPISKMAAMDRARPA